MPQDKAEEENGESNPKETENCGKLEAIRGNSGNPMEQAQSKEAALAELIGSGGESREDRARRVRDLLERGADPANARGDRGESALQAAVRLYRWEIIPDLLAAGADPDEPYPKEMLRGKFAASPMHLMSDFGGWALRGGSPEAERIRSDYLAAFESLAKAGNPDRRNGAGDAPLHIALKSGECDLALRLLDWGARGANPDGKGRLPEDLARKSPKLEMARARLEGIRLQRSLGAALPEPAPKRSEPKGL